MLATFLAALPSFSKYEELPTRVVRALDGMMVISFLMAAFAFISLFVLVLPGPKSDSKDRT